MKEYQILLQKDLQTLSNSFTQLHVTVSNVAFNCYKNYADDMSSCCLGSISNLYNGAKSLFCRVIKNVTSKDAQNNINPRKTNNKIWHCRPGGPPRPTFNFYTQAHLFVRFLEVDTPTYVK